MSLLFSPVSFGSLALKNRIIVAPMCQYSARGWLGHRLAHDASRPARDVRRRPADHRGHGGRAARAHLAGRPGPLVGRQRGGAATACCAPSARTRPSRSAIQLAHAGRKASTPACRGRAARRSRRSERRLADRRALRRALHARRGAADGARRGRTCAAIATPSPSPRAAPTGSSSTPSSCTAAHGYLLHQFLSPLSNRRTRRIRRLAGKPHALSARGFRGGARAFPTEKPVGVRISATDWVEGGWDLEQSITFARELEKRGARYIHVSSGGLSPRRRSRSGPAIRCRSRRGSSEAVSMPVIAVGLITEPKQAEAIIEKGQADADRARARHALRPALALACRRRARRAVRGAAAVLALAAAPVQEPLQPRAGLASSSRLSVLNRRAAADQENDEQNRHRHADEPKQDKRNAAADGWLVEEWVFSCDLSFPLEAFATTRPRHRAFTLERPNFSLKICEFSGRIQQLTKSFPADATKTSSTQSFGTRNHLRKQQNNFLKPYLTERPASALLQVEGGGGEPQ